MAHGADPKLFYSHALRDASNTDTFPDRDRQKYNTRLLLRHGADPNDKTQEVFGFESSPFERAITYKRLGAVREMAKWMETIPEGNYEEQIQKEIDGGQKERGQFLGKVCHKWLHDGYLTWPPTRDRGVDKVGVARVGEALFKVGVALFRVGVAMAKVGVAIVAIVDLVKG